MKTKAVAIYILLSATAIAEPFIGVWVAPTLNYVNGEQCNDGESKCKIWPTDHLARKGNNGGPNITYLASFHRTRARLSHAADAFIEATIGRGRDDRVALVGKWLDGSIAVRQSYIDQDGRQWADVPCPGDRTWWTQTVTRPMIRTALLARKYPDTVVAFALDIEPYGVDLNHYTSPCFCEQCLASGHTRVLPHIMQAMRAAKRITPELEFWLVNADVSDAPIYQDLHLVADKTISERTYVTGFLDHDTCSAERGGKPVSSNIASHIEKWTAGRRCRMVVGLNVPQIRLYGRDRSYDGRARAFRFPVLRNHIQAILAHSDGGIPGLDGVMIYFGGRLQRGDQLDCRDGCCSDYDGDYTHEDYLREINLGLTTPHIGGRYNGEVEDFEHVCHGETVTLRRMVCYGARVPGSRKAGCR